MIDFGFQVFIDEKCDSHPRRRHVTAVVNCVVLISVLWLIVGLPAHGVLPRDGYPFRWELNAVVDCTVGQSPAMDCVFQAYGCLPCDG